MKLILNFIFILSITLTSLSLHAEWISGNAEMQGDQGVCIAINSNGDTVTANCQGEYATCGMSGIPGCGSCTCIIDLPNGQSVSGNVEFITRKISQKKE